MKGVAISDTMTDNSGLSDTTGTRLNVALGSASDKIPNAIKPTGPAVTNATVKYDTAAGAAKSQVFNGSLQVAGQPANTEPLTVTFSAVGLSSGSLNVAPKLLANGEAKTVGAVVQPAVFTYTNVDVLEQRTVKVGATSVTISNALKGSYIGMPVNTTNKDGTDSTICTSVNVAPGGMAMGPAGGTAYLNVVPTTISSNGATVYAQVTQYESGTSKKPIKATSNAVPVTTAEASSVGDTKAYKSLTFTYNAQDVGNASLGSAAAAATGGSLAWGPALSGFVPQGFTLGTFTASPTGAASISLSSKVVPATPAGALLTGGANIYGPVGSEAQILDSTVLATTANVSMSWRQRSSYESHLTNSPAPGEATLAAGTKWLTSDVVQVGGIPSSATAPVVYAMQLSFDNAINTQFDGATKGSMLNEFNANSLYLAQLTSSGVWQNAVTANGTYGGIYGSNAQAHVWDSLSDFLNTQLLKPGYTLESLLGSWGVDPAGQAWAIVDHSGTFAVTPEPATWMLLGAAAGAGLLLYRRRRSAATGK